MYWGRLSHCMKLYWLELEQYSCEDRSAYSSVSAFESIMFVLQTFTAVSVYLWRADLIDEAGRYDQIGDNSSRGFGGQEIPRFNPYANAPAARSYGKIPEYSEQSAEL